jgi:hypothetical protein
MLTRERDHLQRASPAWGKQRHTEWVWDSKTSWERSYASWGKGAEERGNDLLLEDSWGKNLEYGPGERDGQQRPDQAFNVKPRNSHVTQKTMCKQQERMTPSTPCGGKLRIWGGSNAGSAMDSWCYFPGERKAGWTKAGFKTRAFLRCVAWGSNWAPAANLGMHLQKCPQGKGILFWEELTA